MNSSLWLGRVMSVGICLAIAAPASAELRVGYRVKSITVRDGNDKPAAIPDLGKKIVSLFYTDPDASEMNEKFREELKAQKFDKSLHRGMGVVNMKDTWKPNFAIRSVVRKKIKKFKSTILTDPDRKLKNSWHLGDCDDKDVVIIIGADKKVKYLKYTKMSAGERKKGLELVRKLVEELKQKRASK